MGEGVKGKRTDRIFNNKCKGCQRCKKTTIINEGGETSAYKYIYVRFLGREGSYMGKINMFCELHFMHLKRIAL